MNYRPLKDGPKTSPATPADWARIYDAMKRGS